MRFLHEQVSDDALGRFMLAVCVQLCRDYKELDVRKAKVDHDLNSLKIVLVCAFFDSTLQSFRENQFARRLAERGHKVQVITSTESIRWRFNRANAPTNDPSSNDAAYRSISGLTLSRRRPYLRVGDLALFRLSKADFAEADVVHVLDFRQGVTAVAARLARSCGVPVVYDHEQRGDRSGSPLHRLDNAVRHALIRYGASAPSLVRHTVNSNREFFQRLAPNYKGPFALAPLGADEKIFKPDPALRLQTRKELGLRPHDFMWLMTGKMEPEKRVHQVARALARNNRRLFIAGAISDQARRLIEAEGNVHQLGNVSQIAMNGLYNAADCCVFTTFTLSYWEALAAGAQILIPSTSFSDSYLGDRTEVHRYGQPTMFEIEEERYHHDVDLCEMIAPLAKEIEQSRGPRDTPEWLSWSRRIDELEAQYRMLISR